MHNRIPHLLVAACLLLVPTFNVAAAVDSCPQECPCGASVHPGHHPAEYAAGADRCAGVTPCCHIEASPAETPLPVHPVQMPEKPTNHPGVVSVAQRSCTALHHPILYRDLSRPGPSLPAYLQNSALLC